MGIWDHYPAERRRWKPERCVCGLRLRNCPDWRGRLAELTSQSLKAAYRRLGEHFDAEVPVADRLQAITELHEAARAGRRRLESQP